MEHAQDAVGGDIASARWGSDPKTTDVHSDWFVDHAWHEPSRDNHSGVGAGSAGCVMDMFPDQSSAPGHRIDI